MFAKVRTSAGRPLKIHEHLQDTMKQYVRNLLDAVIIEPAHRGLFISYPFLIPKGQSTRFIVDFSHLTPHLEVSKLHLPQFSTILRARDIPTGWLAVRIDITAAFYAVPLHPKTRHLTTFKVHNKRYQFTRLPMGLATSPHALQKILEEILQPVWKEAPLSWIHVDDILIAAPPHRITDLRQQLITSLRRAGFVINITKSQIRPSPKITYLGLDLDFNKRIYMPSQKGMCEC